MKTKMNSQTIETETVDGKKMTIVVVRPVADEISKSQLHSARVVAEAIKSGAIARSKLNIYMREQGLWDDEKQKRVEALNALINDGELALRKGGIKKSEARKIALELRAYRMERNLMLFTRTQLDEYTVEGLAENAKFDYLVAACTKNEEGDRVFEDLSAYKNKQDEPYAAAAAGALSSIIYGTDPDWEKKLPENQFLINQKFVDDKLRLINKDGKLVDSEGRLVDDNGRYINPEGQYVNRDGERVDAEGDVLVETSPFLEDEEEQEDTSNEKC